MGWTTEEQPIIYVHDGAEVPCSSTSTSTVLAQDGAGSCWLRTFGIDAQQLAFNVPQTKREDWTEGPPEHTGVVEQGGAADGMHWNISFAEGHAAASAGAGAADLLPVRLDSSTKPVIETVVPSWKEGKVLPCSDFSWSAGVLYGRTTSNEASTVHYKDACVVELPDKQGWLMLLARYHRADSDSAAPYQGWPLKDSPDHTSSRSAIVAYWAPSHDGTFTGGMVRGPYWLVRALQEENNSSGEDRRVRMWLGVPGAVAIEADGEQVLYLYYVAEPSSYPEPDAEEAASDNNYLSGVWLRKIRLSDFLDVLPPFGVLREARVWEDSPRGRAAEAALHAIDATSDEAPPDTSDDDGVWTEEDYNWMDERKWDEEDEDYLVPGEVVGKVRVWVASGLPFDDAVDALAAGNTEIEVHYRRLKLVDPMPVVCRKRISLFFSANNMDDPNPVSTEWGWGIWRAASVPPQRTTRFGAEFVGFPHVYPSVGSDQGERDMAIESTDSIVNNGNPSLSELTMHLDPDPVSLPDGTVLVFAGHSPDKTTGLAEDLRGAVGTHDVACARFPAAWHEWFSLGVEAPLRADDAFLS